MRRTIRGEQRVVLIAVMTLTVGCAGGALVDVPDSHPAAELVAGGAADTQGFAKEALALDLAFSLWCRRWASPVAAVPRTQRRNHSPRHVREHRRDCRSGHWDRPR